MQRGAYGKISGDFLRAQGVVAPTIVEDDGDYHDAPDLIDIVGLEAPDSTPSRHRRKRLDKRHRRQLQARKNIVASAKRLDILFKEDVPSGLLCGTKMSSGVFLVVC